MDRLVRFDLLDQERREAELATGDLERILPGVPESGDLLAAYDDELPFMNQEFLKVSPVLSQFTFEGHGELPKDRARPKRQSITADTKRESQVLGLGPAGVPMSSWLEGPGSPGACSGRSDVQVPKNPRSHPGAVVICPRDPGSSL